MMRLLHWALRPRSRHDAFPTSQWGAPPDAGMLKKLGLANAALSVLYSDVGPEFYRACGTKPGTRDGWATLGARATFLRLPASVPSDNCGGGDGGAGGRVALLTADDVRALYAHDAHWLRADVARAAVADPGRTQFSFLPDAGVGAYPARRTMSFAAANEPGGALQPIFPLQHWGAVLLPEGAETFADTLELLATSASASASGEEGVKDGPRCDFITWTLDSAPPEPRTLVAARTRASPATFPALLIAFLRAARAAGCERAEFWGLAPELRAVAEGQGQRWETGERTEHLSAVKWYGLEGEGEDGGRLDWLHNEKCVSKGTMSSLTYPLKHSPRCTDSAGARPRPLRTHTATLLENPIRSEV